MEGSSWHLMCWKASEIQEMWEPKEGDHVYNSLGNKKRGHVKINGDIWLPSQAQLQEMLVGDGQNRTYCTAVSPQGNKTYKYGFTEILLTRCILNNFTCWCNEFKYGEYISPLQCFMSMEQLWLAYVMYEKYEKKWDGKEWK